MCCLLSVVKLRLVVQVSLIASSVQASCPSSRRLVLESVERLHAVCTEHAQSSSHVHNDLIVLLLLLLDVPVRLYARSSALYDIVVRTSLAWIHSRWER